MSVDKIFLIFSSFSHNSRMPQFILCNGQYPRVVTAVHLWVHTTAKNLTYWTKRKQNWNILYSFWFLFLYIRIWLDICVSLYSFKFLNKIFENRNCSLYLLKVINLWQPRWIRWFLAFAIFLFFFLIAVIIRGTH